MKDKFWFSGFFLLALFFVNSCGPKNESKRAFEAADYPRAISLLKQELATDSTNVDGWRMLAESYEKVGAADSAIMACQKAHTLKPQDRDIKAQLVRLYIWKGKQLREEKRFFKALGYFDAAEKVGPPNFDIYYERGLTYLKARYLEKAKAQFEKAAEISKQDPRPAQKLAEISQQEKKEQAYYQKGKKFYQQKRWDRAIAQLDQAVKLKADDKEAKYLWHMARGRRLYKKGSVSALWDAISEFGLAANIHPDRPEPQYYMALSYEKKDRNDFTMPVEVYQKVIELDPQGTYAQKAKRRIRYLTNMKRKLDKFWGKKKKK